MEKLIRLVSLAVVFLAPVAFAQPTSLMAGADTTTQPDGGIIRKVQVDPQGRLVVVSIGGSSGADGGVTTTGAVYTQTCTGTQQTVTSVGTSASSLPVLATRWYTRVCNSAENSGNPLVKCRDDAVAPVMGTTQPGEALGPGDCVTYFTTSAIQCISNTAATAVSQSECR